MKRIYLDYAATTPIDSKVFLAMKPYMQKEYGNPSSMHSFGQKARAGIEQAREHVAGFLGVQPLEIVCTSSATEANNLAVQGVLGSLAPKYLGAKLPRPHVIVSAIEHESVLSVVQHLEQQGKIKATYISPTQEGVIQVQDIEKALQPNTILVSVMYVNSETGIVQPVREIGLMLKAYKKQNTKSNVVFHTDAVQAVQFADCAVSKLHVDLLTVSSHKVYGSKGVGALFVKEGTGISPVIVGGGQEQGMRSGTENVAAIVGMGAAFQELASPRMGVARVKMHQLRDRLETMLVKKISGCEVTGKKEERIGSTLHMRIAGIQGKDLVLLLDQKGIAVSTGSACSERSQEPSHVLLAMGYSAQEALSSVRLSVGKNTTKEEIEKVIKSMPTLVEKLRKNKV